MRKSFNLQSIRWKAFDLPDRPPVILNEEMERFEKM